MSPTRSEKSSFFEWACVNEALTGQAESGDHCVVKSFPEGVLLGIVDGLGHGREAAEAAQMAVRILETDPRDSVVSLVQKVHEGLRRTRGVVMTLASLNFTDLSLTWMGVGNVQGMIFHRDSKDNVPYGSVLLRGGVVGLQLPELKAEVTPIREGDLLIFATDGIDSDFTVGISLKDDPQKIAERILKEHLKGNDDALVMVVRYLGG